jgi:hypothetical protein
MKVICNHNFTAFHHMEPTTVQLRIVHQEISNDGAKTALRGVCFCGNSYMYDPYCLLEESSTFCIKEIRD